MEQIEPLGNAGECDKRDNGLVRGEEQKLTTAQPIANTLLLFIYIISYTIFQPKLIPN